MLISSLMRFSASSVCVLTHSVFASIVEVLRVNCKLLFLQVEEKGEEEAEEVVGTLSMLGRTSGPRIELR